MEEVFERLKCTKNGLTSEEVEERIAAFGYNKLEEKKVNWPFLLRQKINIVDFIVNTYIGIVSPFIFLTKYLEMVLWGRKIRY